MRVFGVPESNLFIKHQHKIALAKLLDYLLDFFFLVFGRLFKVEIYYNRLWLITVVNLHVWHG